MILHSYLLGLTVMLSTFTSLLAAFAFKWKGNITQTHWELLIWTAVLTFVAGVAAGLTH